MSIKSYKFDKYLGFSNILNVGATTNHSTRELKEVLVVMDITGSMGGNINNNSYDGSKWNVAKIILQKLELKGVKVRVLPFNCATYQICSISEIPEPNECTYFSPIVPRLEYIFKNEHNYSAVIFASDGLPSEEKEVAMKAISRIGILVRENNCNPVSLAIGDDADGVACAKFAGNRGYECFIKTLTQLEQVVDDIYTGLKCNYKMLQDGNYVPIEKDGNYYYLSNNTEGTETSPDFDTTFKFINLTLLAEFSKVEPNYKNLKEFINHTVLVEPNIAKREMMVNHFDKVIRNVIEVTKDQYRTPSNISSQKYAMRQASQQA